MITYQSYLQKWFILIIFGNMINCIIFSVLLQIAEAIDAVFHMISESILYTVCVWFSLQTCKVACKKYISFWFITCWSDLILKPIINIWQKMPKLLEIIWTTIKYHIKRNCSRKHYLQRVLLCIVEWIGKNRLDVSYIEKPFSTIN